MQPGAYTRRNVDLATSLRAFRDLPVGVAVWRLCDFNDVRSLRFVAVNPACERELRAPLGFAIGKPITECFPRLLDTPAPERCRHVALSGKPETVGEIVYQDARIPKGIFWIDCFPLPDGCVGVALENITERKRMVESQSRALDVLHRITVRLNQAQSVLEATQICVDEICPQIGWPVGRFFLSDETSPSRYLPNPVWHFSDAQRFRAFRRATELYERDVTNRLSIEYRTIQGQKAGLTRSVGFSVVENGFLRGVLEFSSDSAEPLDSNFKRMISNVGFQLGQLFARERAARECHNLRQRIDSQNAQRNALSKMLFSGRTSLSADLASLESLPRGRQSTTAAQQFLESTRRMRQHLDELKHLTAMPLEFHTSRAQIGRA